ncbi:MAG: alpha/beta hydrolase-fold protein [Chloroflexota bacterium]
MSDVLISTIEYGTGGGRPLTMHLLQAQPRPAGSAPGLVWVHGGAFRHGSKDSGIAKLFPFARRGYVCASIEYRLSGEATWPAQIEDCKAAVRYLRAHADELGLDPERIGAWGASAGGHLVAMLGAAVDRPELEGQGGWPEYPSRVQAVCDYYGPADLLAMVDQPSALDHSEADSPEGMLLGGAVLEHPDRARSASPVSYATGDEPPFLIVHGAEDMTVPHPQSQAMYQAMGSGSAIFHTVLGAGHGGPAFEHPAVVRHVEAFFDRHLGPIPLPAPPDATPRAVPPAPQLVTVNARAWVNPDATPPLTTFETFESRAVGGQVGYSLYRPPGYSDNPQRRYPVIYWLHGMGGDPRRGGTFVRMLDEAIRAGIAPAALAVLPNGGPAGFYCDWPGGEWPIETVIMDELIPHVDATYRTLSGREGRCIEGQSMGGFGAAHLGFKYPELFGAISISAGALIDFSSPRPSDDVRRARVFNTVWGGDAARFHADDPFTLARASAEQIRGRTAVRIFCGDQDSLLGLNTRFSDLLRELDIAHEYTIVPGAGHPYDEKIERLGVGHFGFFAQAFAESVAGAGR